jgi:hypothetical protein
MLYLLIRKTGKARKERTRDKVKNKLGKEVKKKRILRPT